jgi:hypothetical protein
MHRSLALLAAVGLLIGIVAGCGATPIEPASSTLRVEPVQGPNAPISFGGTGWRARLTTAAGGSVGEFEFGGERAPVLVLPGDYVLETWMVSLSDVIMCPAQPAGQAGDDGCTRDEGPPQARCGLALTIPPGTLVVVRYTVIDATICRLEVA